MQKIWIIVLLCICQIFTYGQYFSGEIQYKSTIIDKETGQIMRVHTSTLIIGDGFYRKRQNTQNEFLYETTYIENEGKLYSQRGNNPYITYEVLNPVEGDYTPYKIYRDSTDNVLGHEVFLGSKRFPKMTEKNYYSNSIRVNPDDYAGYCTGRKNDHLKQLEGRLPLKTISIYDDYDFIAINEAVKIKKKRLRPRDMQFPKDKNIAARYDRTLQHNPYYANLTKDYANCLYSKTNKKSQYYDAAYIEKHTKTVSFKMIWTKEKEIKNLTIIKSDDEMLNQKAIDIINDCKPNFGVIKLNDIPVDMEVFYNVVFFEELSENN